MFSIPFFIMILFHAGTTVASDVRCVDYIDITDGERNGKNITKDGLTFDENHYFTLGDSIKGCICDVKQCIRKCCLEGQKLNFTSRECVDDSDSALNNFSLHHIINVPTKNICDESKIKIIIDEFKVEENVLVADFITLSMEEFCLSAEGGRNIAVGCVVTEEVPGILYSIDDRVLEDNDSSQEDDPNDTNKDSDDDNDDDEDASFFCDVTID